MGRFPGFLRLFAVGAVGIAALVATFAFPDHILARAGIGERDLRILAGAQSALLLAAAVVIGNLTSGKTGFVSWIGRPDQAPLSFRGASAILFALIAFGLGILVTVSQDWLVQHNGQFNDFLTQEGDALSSLRPPLIVRLLYGGITEEIFLRWGVMGLLAWLFLKTMGSNSALTLAVVTSAALFALGHLPTILALTVNPPASFLLFTGLANFSFGLVLGVALWRHSLEAAMLAHVLAHLGMMVPFLQL